MNTQQLRETAQLAHEIGGIAKYLRGKQAMEKFSAEFTPAVVVMVFEQLEAAERERDEYAEAERSAAVKNVTLQDEIYGLKAEIARRDAAAGEPDGYIFCHPSGKNFWSVSHDDTAGHNGVKPFYFSAPPAVLPPAISTDGLDPESRDIDEVRNLAHIVGANWMRQQCLELGAQQEVVELPSNIRTELVNFLTWIERLPVPTISAAAKAIRLRKVISEIDAANVKWEVKK